MTISEVCEKYGFSADTLRYYEKIGLIEPVKKDQRGRRDYGDKDLSRIEFIKCMRSAGISIDAIKKYVMLLQDAPNTVNQRREILVQQRTLLQQKIKEMQISLEFLNKKIEKYDKRQH